MLLPENAFAQMINIAFQKCKHKSALYLILIKYIHILLLDKARLFQGKT